MVRRSILVYDLLCTEQPPDGFTEKEILTHISNKYDIAAGKTLQRDIALALRRGIDYGILAKKRNKFRFDPNFHQTASSSLNNARRNTRTKKKTRRSGKKKTTSRSTAAKRRRQRRRSPTRSSRSRKQSSSVPRPTLPRPPSWSPKRRNLTEEPIPKMKHS
ncbi:uncharacterized protein LOC109858689 [Pseudomyrmex gracilis]|uniref:uncharacterized protein LOC109858689 n=1 Tax=Pseudomyrmex gracilis TaxID=219809 RepID=UPI000995BA0B|nr:uncharacterized protein LOC109858689 [Pseudomyrmex gracilis]